MGHTASVIAQKKRRATQQQQLQKLTEPCSSPPIAASPRNWEIGEIRSLQCDDALFPPVFRTLRSTNENLMAICEQSWKRIKAGKSLYYQEARKNNPALSDLSPVSFFSFQFYRDFFGVEEAMIHRAFADGMGRLQLKLIDTMEAVIQEDPGTTRQAAFLANIAAMHTHDHGVKAQSYGKFAVVLLATIQRHLGNSKVGKRCNAFSRSSDCETRQAWEIVLGSVVRIMISASVQTESLQAASTLMSLQSNKKMVHERAQVMCNSLEDSFISQLTKVT